MPQIDRQTTFSGTKEVAAPLAIDLDRLQAFLASRRPEFDTALAGTAASEEAAAMAPLVRPLAAKAWEFAREAGAQ